MKSIKQILFVVILMNIAFLSAQDIPIWEPPQIDQNTTITAKSFSELDVNNLPNVESINISAPPPRFTTTTATPGFIYYGSRAAFYADHGAYPVEGFENTLVPPGFIIADAGPLNSATDNSLFAPGGIISGISFSNWFAQFGALMVVIGDGIFSPTTIIGPNTFADDMEITFDVRTNAVGIDLYVPYSFDIIDFHIFGPGDEYLGSFGVIDWDYPSFYGVYSPDTPIAKIRTVGRNGAGELIDDVTVAALVGIDGHIKDSDGNAIEGAEVVFSNGGATLTTSASGHYATSVGYGWHGTSTAMMPGYSFEPSVRTYDRISTSMPGQDFVGAPLPGNLAINGYITDGEGNGIGGVEVAFSNGGASVFTTSAGYYETGVSWGWGGTVTPMMEGYTFSPPLLDFPGHLAEDQLDQNFTASMASSQTLGVNDNNSLPNDFTILPAYPNPFNPSTTIEYGINRENLVTIDIYDLTGTLITTLLNTNQLAGWHSVDWNGTNQNGEQVPAGMYLSKITSGNEVRTTKLMFVK